MYIPFCSSFLTLGVCCLVRPATTDAVDESAPMIGIPSGFSAPTQVAAKKYWFVALRPVKETTSTFRELPFEGLKLGPQLGRGGLPKAYQMTCP